ncbi:MAG: tetratricopeptide repeat protein [Anaerolineae bacterium]
MLQFGDHLSNALHAIKRSSGKKIGLLMDEIGYGFDPHISGDTIEHWRYRKAPPTLAHLEKLTDLIHAYGAAEHDIEWFTLFLESAGHPYPEKVLHPLFPNEINVAEPIGVQSSPHLKPPPITAYSAPSFAGLVGRSVELNVYSEQLEQFHFAVISGMAGVGKSALMSLLAAESKLPVFWHNFEQRSIESMVGRLTGFIANLGQETLWQSLESTRLGGGQPLNIETVIDLLSHILLELDQTVLLCFDGLQFVDDDVNLKRLLLQMLPMPHLKLCFTTRRFPSFFPRGHEIQLDGLSLIETTTLFSERLIDLEAALLSQIHSTTRGNSAFLTLSAVILAGHPRPETMVARLAQTDDLERWLMTEVADRLNAEESAVLSGIAVLCGFPATRELLEEMLDGIDVRRTLRSLSDQYLLLIDQNIDGERSFRQHQLIQTFFYEQPRLAQKREWHQRAANYFSTARDEPLQHFFHRVRAGEMPQAIRVTQDRLNDIINRGEGKKLQTILTEIEKQQKRLEPLDRVRLCLCFGQVLTVIDDLDKAMRYLLDGAQLLQDAPADLEEDDLECKICLAAAKALERKDPPEALRWVQRGTALAAEASPEVRSDLRITEGLLHHHVGNFGEALESLMDGMEALQPEQTAIRATALNTLGGVNGMLGNFQAARDYSLKALKVSQQTENHLEKSRIKSNLGWFHYVLGDRQAAVASLEEGVEIAKKLGAKDSEMSIQINLGGCYVEMGDYKLAATHLQRGVELAEQFDSIQIVTALIRLGELCTKQENWEEALSYLDRGEDIALKKNLQAELASIDGFQALSLAHLGQTQKSFKRIAKAIKQDQLLGDKWSLGILFRIEGEVYFLAEEWARAQQAFQKSIEILDQIDQFQAAKSRFEFGMWCWHQKEVERAIHLVESAQNEFEKFPQSPEFQASVTWLEALNLNR